MLKMSDLKATAQATLSSFRDARNPRQMAITSVLSDAQEAMDFGMPAAHVAMLINVAKILVCEAEGDSKGGPAFEAEVTGKAEARLDRVVAA